MLHGDLRLGTQLVPAWLVEPEEVRDRPISGFSHRSSRARMTGSGSTKPLQPWSVPGSNRRPSACKAIQLPDANRPRSTRPASLSQVRACRRTTLDTVRQVCARTALAPPPPNGQRTLALRASLLSGELVAGEPARLEGQPRRRVVICPERVLGEQRMETGIRLMGLHRRVTAIISWIVATGRRSSGSDLTSRFRAAGNPRQDPAWQERGRTVTLAQWRNYRAAPSPSSSRISRGRRSFSTGSRIATAKSSTSIGACSRRRSSRTAAWSSTGRRSPSSRSSRGCATRRRQPPTRSARSRRTSGRTARRSRCGWDSMQESRSSRATATSASPWPARPASGPQRTGVRCCSRALPGDCSPSAPACALSAPTP